MTKKDKINILILAVLILLLIAMVVQLFPLLEDVLENRADESSLALTVDALGWRGPVSLIGLAALQVIFPVIPAVAIGILTGLSYGVYWGSLIFLGGIALGNAVVVFAIRRIDTLFAGKVKHKGKHHRMLSKENLERIQKPEIVAFFLFIIPFISGAGPYLFAETKVKLWKYLIAVVAGSLPTTIVYVFLGERISQGSYTTAIITGSVLVVAMVLILIFRKKILGVILADSDESCYNDVAEVIDKYHVESADIIDECIDEAKEKKKDHEDELKETVNGEPE